MDMASTNIVKFVILIGLTLVRSETCTPCTLPWIPFRDHCYLFPNHMLAWHKAERYCVSFDREGYSEGHLASVHSQEENDWIRMRLVKKRQNYGNDYDAWNGYHYSPDNAGFIWSDQTSNDFENWKDGQPDNVATYGISCAILGGNSEKWWDKDCQSSRYFVCKRAASF